MGYRVRLGGSPPDNGKIVTEPEENDSETHDTMDALAFELGIHISSVREIATEFNDLFCIERRIYSLKGLAR